MLGLDSLAWWTVKGSATLAGAALMAFILRRRPAAVRHAVWMIAIAMQLVVPWAPRLLPAGSFGVSVPELVRASAPLVRLQSTSAGPKVALPFPANVARTPAMTTEEPRPAPSTRPIAAALIVVLAAGSALHLIRLLLGWRRLAVLARRAERVTEKEWGSTMRECRQSLGIARPVILIRSDAIQVPVTWGIREPKLLLPEKVRSLRQGSSRLMVMQAMVQHSDPTVQRAALASIRLVPEDLWRRDLLLAIAPQALAPGSSLVDAWFSALTTLSAPLHRRELRASVHELELPTAIVHRLAAELG